MTPDEQPRDFRHEPVLLKQVLDRVTPASEAGVIVDATLGLGGHAEAFLERYPEITLVGIDRDPAALERAAERLKRFEHRVRFVRDRHEKLIEILQQLNIDKVDAILADLGVSSMQLDDRNRGFSFRFDAPLDMRMGDEGSTAADLVNTLDESELASILYEYGEEPMSRRIARAIVERRSEEPILTTAQLAGIIRSVKHQRPNERIDPATLTFQALRIATNRELVELGQFVADAAEVLARGGRLGVISFHSLEDRIVKRQLRKLEGECVCPPGLPVCGCGAVEIVKVLTSRPIVPDDDESRRNPRARSSRMRVAEKR